MPSSTVDDSELRPMVEPVLNEKYAAKTPCHYKKWAIVCSVAVVVVVVYCFAVRGGDKSDGSPSSYSHHEIHQTIHTTASTATTTNGDSSPTTDVQPIHKPVPTPVAKPTTKAKSKSKGKPLNVAALTDAFKVAREAMIAKLRLLYGTHFDFIFYLNGVSYGRSVFTSGNITSTVPWARFQRKFMIKILQQSQGNAKGELVPFVWATGGHSASASHGNFHNQSYTAYMEEAVREVFQAVGINFTARKYSMGGTASCMEVALCAKEIFGADLDAYVWDFGMTDGNNIWKQTLYQWRGAILSKTKPVLMVFHTGDGFLPVQQKAMTLLEDLGFASLISSEKILNEVNAFIPDTFGLNDAEIQAMPTLVRNFKCDGKMELGDPYCETERFNLSYCPERKGRVSWHPGFKMHALHGYLAAFFLLELLEDALKELAAQSESDPTLLLRQLQTAEEADYDKFVKAPVPVALFEDVFPPSGEDGFDLDLLVKGHNFCHTAKLPAEIRYKGILTESSQTGSFTYDKGTSLSKLWKTENPGELMRLAYTDEDQRDCPEWLEIVDFKDYFYLGVEEGWKKLTVPNNAALKEYGNGQPLRGLVMFCHALCEWGNCPPGSVGWGLDHYEIKINDVAVTDVVANLECFIARNENGFKWIPNADGRFDFSMRVNPTAAPGAFVQLSAVVVW